IGAILAKDIADPRIGFATITDVETVPDLSHAKVWVSVIGQPAERQATVRALGHALPYIRRQLGTRLHLRRIPELHLELDDTAERGTRVLKLLEDLEAGRTPEADAAPAESLPTPTTGRTDHREEATPPTRRPGTARRTPRDRRGAGRSR
ncbi:MAG TPA: 30S ribosome-binding factor RbfA, partial [Candidatus Limnocylindrales bacterium]